MGKPKISVVIPARNEAKNVVQCLEAVFSQSLGPYEVIIIDGYSTDDTVEKAKGFPVKILYEDASSIACARQIGVENSEAEYIAFTDADCIPAKEWLSNLFMGFGEGIIGVGGAAKNIGESLWEKSVNLALGTFLGGAMTLQSRIYRDRRYVKSIGGFNSMYRREDILKAGGFDTSLPGGEDLELNKRLSKIGKLLYVPEAVVLHQHSWTPGKFAKKMFRYGKERGMIRAWDLQVVPPLIIPLVFLSILINYWIIVSLLGLYCVLLAAMALKVTFKEKNIRYLFSISVVYIVEHAAYTVGFWKGIIFPRKTRTKYI
jgi:glycosyltransferase involved in cell wall biosynthesis